MGRQENSDNVICEHILGDNSPTLWGPGRLPRGGGFELSREGQWRGYPSQGEQAVPGNRGLDMVHFIPGAPKQFSWRGVSGMGWWELMLERGQGQITGARSTISGAAVLFCRCGRVCPGARRLPHQCPVSEHTHLLQVLLQAWLPRGGQAV